MNYTSTITLPDLELTAGPHAALTLRLGRPVTLRVHYLHEAGYPAVPTLPNGDPGEPGDPGLFDFQRILTTDPLCLTVPGTLFRFLAPAGEDIYELLDDQQLANIEHDILAAREEDLDVDAFLPSFPFVLATEGRS